MIIGTNLKVLVCFLISLAALILAILAFIHSKKTKSFSDDQLCYTAAVLDHVLQATDDSSLKQNIETNLKVFADSAKIAKENGADLIVFPENGILNPIFDREIAKQYASTIPSSNEILCNISAEPNEASKPVIERLSCLARENKIFLAANLLDQQKCSAFNLTNNIRTKCPEDGVFIFNTAVLFDRDGRLLAKYHKMQPFGEMHLNAPPNEEIVWVDTEIGRLGMQICFDMIFQKPGYWMVEHDNVDTILFPTHWFDEALFLSGAQYQMAWAVGNQINVLASNMHSTQHQSVGSGIYSGFNLEFVFAHFPNSNKDHLVIGQVPIRPRSGTKCDSNQNKIIEIKTPIKEDWSIYNYQQMSYEDIDWRVLDHQNSAELCSNGVCCQVEFDLSNPITSSNEKLYLFASNRTRKTAYPWTEEFCAIALCSFNDNNFDCLSQNTSSFRYIKLIGDFSKSTTVYPSALQEAHRPIKANFWSYQKSTQTRHDLQLGWKQSKVAVIPLNTLALYGRVYDRDPPYQQKPLKPNKKKFNF